MFLDILFLSLFAISSGKFNKFDASNAILFQIQVFGKDIKKTTLVSYITKVTADPSYMRFRVINQINKIH